LIKLHDQNPDTYWIDLPAGVRLQVKPATTTLIVLSRIHAGEAISGRELTKETEALARVELVKALGRLAIVGWEGVAGKDGEQIEPTSQRIDQLLALLPVYDAFEDVYVRPLQRLVEEKNG
jgi:hypothetical protein